ncbi:MULTISPECIES: transposase [unclassified Streptomyces]|uniref:IS66 family transposase n=1 Tax=unclassified Streptomyces TaxID=2593676 RepID=UPI00386F84E6|nr:transposase [Streptomyces sp. NBC_01017]WSV35055.1 transposase [Streptomyces sp. NBC_01017]
MPGRAGRSTGRTCGPTPPTWEAKCYLHVHCTGAVAVYDRYHNYDGTQLGSLNHQLCLAHVLRGLASAAELYLDDTWPTQLAG